MNEVLSGHKSEKPQPWNCWQEKGGQCLRGRIAQSDTCLLSHQVSEFTTHTHGADTWILLILTGGDHYKKDTKNINEIGHSSFERLKPGHNSAFFSISSFESKTGANVPAVSRTVAAKGPLLGKGSRTMPWSHQRDSSGREKLDSCTPLFCQSFGITHGTCHLTSQCLSSSI